jgi:hypothetical protein
MRVVHNHGETLPGRIDLGGLALLAERANRLRYEGKLLNRRDNNRHAAGMQNESAGRF